jgi:transcriptional regulator with XRE-family HTH domain
MGKEVGAGPEAAALNGAASGVGSVGSYLAQQRRLRGMSVDELASLTKIPRRSLERLEAGAFDGAPDGFARGFVRTVAAALGLDPDDAVNRLLAEPREDEARLRAGARRDQRQLLWWGGAVAAALVALLVLWRMANPGATDESPSADPVVYRHDAVRALAGEPESKPAPAAPNARRQGSGSR